MARSVLLGLGSIPRRGTSFLPFGAPTLDTLDTLSTLFDTLSLRPSAQADASPAVRHGLAHYKQRRPLVPEGVAIVPFRFCSS